MRKSLLSCLAALLSVSLAAPALANELNYARLCPVADEFTVVCPAGWRASDSEYAFTSSDNYVWLYLLWNDDTCISISKDNLGKKFKGFNLAGATRRKMDEVYRAYLKVRPGSGKIKTTYLETTLSYNESAIPFLISRCVGSEYAAKPKDDQLYYYYEAFTIVDGWRICLMAYSNTQNPRNDAGDADLLALKDVVSSFALVK